MAAIGLREQKKAETREAISLAAIRLTSERGLDGVTGDDIAEAAHVARRTFRNYFPNKEAAILHAIDTFVMHYVQLVKDRDRSEPVLDILEAAAIDLVESPNMVDRVITLRTLSRENPQLRVRWSATRSGLDFSELTDEIASRTNTNPDKDVYPRVVTQCAWGTITAALDMQSDGDDLEELVARIHLGFATLANGLSKPVKNKK